MQPSPQPVAFMEVCGHSLAVQQAGQQDSPLVLLLHHGLGSIQSWSQQIPFLAQAGYRVVAYDRWGYGRSGARLRLDVPSFADDLVDLEALLDQLEVQEAALVGHSDGGTLALIFASRYPERATCLVTIAAHIYVEPKMLPGIEGLRQAFLTQERFRKGLQRLHGEKVDAVFSNWYEGWVQESNLSWDLRPALAQIRCPVLVVQGELDEHATPQHARDLAEAIPGAVLWLLESAGHMLPQENADIFNKRLLELLTQPGMGAR